MTKKNNSLALPVRMSLAVDSLVNMKIAVLMFPFAREVDNFRSKIAEVLRQQKRNAPYRQLNNGLLACTSTLTYGFEKFEVVDYIDRYRALAVGTRENPLRVPEPEQIHELIFIWAQTWTKQYLGRQGNQDEIASVCDRFLDAIADVPASWDWESIEPQTLIQDTSAENSLCYQAIPSLLATLLHERTCTISSGDREQIIKWRKVQGGGFGKVGLYLISQPFKAIYYDDDGKEKEGYFAYRLDFYLQTQAGQLNSEGKLKPWIFLHFSCQRYAHEPLVDANFRRDISILMGMNQERLDNFPIDSTLVRLVIDNSTNRDKCWKEQLTKLLAAFKARSLTKPPNILNNPAELGNLDNLSNWKDEYYLVHAEGYKYKQAQKRGKGHGHSIKTGFSLKERGDITAQVLQQLDDILIPDVPMECDIPTPSGQNTPLAMCNYEFIQKPLYFTPKKRENLGEQEIKRQQEQHRQQRKTIIDDALKRATNGKPIHLFILCYEADTHDLIIQQLQQVFLLKENENFLEHIKVTYVHVEDANLLQKLPVDELPSVNNEFDKQIKKEHQKKREAWQAFIQQKVIPLVDCHINPYIFAIVEIGKVKEPGKHPKQSIRGAVREACALKNISSQMIQTVELKKKDSQATKGRVTSTVLDVTLRQTGTLYGLPTEIYRSAKIPENIAKELDVIAFCRLQKNNRGSKFQYAIAVRLRANGTVDVLLPHGKEWIPYALAGIELGKLFSQARRGDRKYSSQLQMKGSQLAKFAADVLTQCLEKPTIALIEADVWRNERSKDEAGTAWFQLKNEYLFEKRDVLDFQHVLGHNCLYQRDNQKLNNLLGVVRLRSDRETPQYITNRRDWNEDSTARDFTKLSGFVDKTVPDLIHYFSVGRIPETQKKAQDSPVTKDLYKLDRHVAEKGYQKDEYAADIAFKHQQMVEMVPFFVRPDFQMAEAVTALCRVPHYLRTSPAWRMGNIHFPYPMHLGKLLLDDYLCILGIE